MNRILKFAATACLALAIILVGKPSEAVTITPSTNNPYTFNWSFATPNPGSYNLTGNGSITVSGFNSNLLTLVITLNNTSPNGGQGGDRLAVFGFGINPNFGGGVNFIDAADDGMIGAAAGNFPSVEGVEVCAYGGNNCASGGNGGIFAGASDTFTLTLNGTWGNSVDIDPVAFKYQTGNGSFEFTGNQTTGTGTGTGSGAGGGAPEPASLLLMGAGLAAAAWKIRRSKASA